MKSSGWTISQYDVYRIELSSISGQRGAVSTLISSFAPRFALTAKAAPSVVYDYYNPDARAVVSPVTFVVVR